MKNSSRFLEIFTPSWLSGLVAVTVGIFIAVGTLVISRLSNSGLSSTIFAAVAGKDSAYQTVAKNLSRYAVINYLPLYLFWAGVGVIVYFLAVHLYKAFTEAVTLESKLSYVNANRHAVIKQSLLHMVIRSVALALWIIFILFTLRQVLPYGLLQVHDVAGRLNTHTFLVTAGVAAMFALDIFVHAILLRWLFLRGRLFGEAFYR